MAENLVVTVQEMLKEETYTRATISNYTQNNLVELAAVVEKIRNENCIKEVLAICEEHLSHTKDSIIALYLSGILSLLQGTLDNSSLVDLVDIFKKNHKDQIVVYLCKSILDDDPSNKFALRTLAEAYEAENNPEVWDLYEKIVKIDFAEADLAKLLAEHYEENNDKETAVEYYKKAILRYVNAQNFNSTKEVWAKLVEQVPEQIDFFQLVRRKIAKTMGEIKTTTLMQELYNKYKDSCKWDTAIEILKQNLAIEPKDSWARKEIEYCYRGKYASHSHLDNYIRSSNLSQSFRNIFEAINDFEKHIAFDKNNFVFHRSWGVGKIKKLQNDTLIINFGKTAGIHEMSLKMAVSALKPLDKDHIWVKKATTNLEQLKKDFSVKDENVPGLLPKMSKEEKDSLKHQKMRDILILIIKSFDNNCDFKKIKAELVPSIVATSEWTAWSNCAKKVLDEDATFGVNPNDISMYTVRDGKAITPAEKLSNEFKAQKQFFARIDILMKFFNNDDTHMDKSSDLFAEMYSYFTGFLKSIPRVNEQVIASYLVVHRISASDKQFAFPMTETFADLYGRLEDPRETYSALKDSKNTSLRADFLAAIKMLPNWHEEYIRLFPTVLDEKLLSDLTKSGYTEDVQKLVKTSFEQFKDYRETVLFFFKNCQEEEWFKNAGVTYERQLITLINIIELTFREINNHVNSTENKKINKNATLLLFSDEAVKYMFDNDEDTVKKMYTLIDDIADMDSTYKAQARNKILDKYPSFKFRVSEEKSAQPKGMLVTAKMLEIKRAEVDRLQNIDIPMNADAVADARAKGDLKENAEYKAAREQQHMLNLKLSNLQTEINRAVVFDPTTSTTAIVSFATVVTLTDNTTGKEEKYTILGPWESDPDNNIISYMSPFGNAIMEKKVGDSASFTINEHKYSYTIKSIEKASL